LLSGDFLNRVAKQYHDETLRRVAESLIGRLSGDPLTLAACVQAMLKDSKISMEKDFWDFVPSSIEPTEALAEVVGGVLMTLDKNEESVRGVAAHLLDLAGYESKAKLLRKV